MNKNKKITDILDNQKNIKKEELMLFLESFNHKEKIEFFSFDENIYSHNHSFIFKKIIENIEDLHYFIGDFSQKELMFILRKNKLLTSNTTLEISKLLTLENQLFLVKNFYKDSSIYHNFDIDLNNINLRPLSKSTSQLEDYLDFCLLLVNNPFIDADIKNSILSNFENIIFNESLKLDFSESCIQLFFKNKNWFKQIHNNIDGLTFLFHNLFQANYKKTDLLFEGFYDSLQNKEFIDFILHREKNVIYEMCYFYKTFPNETFFSHFDKKTILDLMPKKRILEINPLLLFNENFQKSFDSLIELTSYKHIVGNRKNEESLVNYFFNNKLFNNKLFGENNYLFSIYSLMFTSKRLLETGKIKNKELNLILHIFQHFTNIGNDTLKISVFYKEIDKNKNSLLIKKILKKTKEEEEIFTLVEKLKLKETLFE